MTLEQAITAFDQTQPNAFTRAEKLRWLSELDGQLWDQILRHRGDPIPMPAYDENTPADTPLALPDPYCGLYQVYLSMQANRLNGEIARYNNDAELFNRTLRSIQSHWIRTNPAPTPVCLRL